MSDDTPQFDLLGLAADLKGVDPAARQRRFQELGLSPEQIQEVRDYLIGGRKTEASSFAKAQASPSPDGSEDDEPPNKETSAAFSVCRGAKLGPFKLLEKLGEGGLGEVWKAEQRYPLHRHVAIKFIKAGMDSKAVIARFEAERQALAMMNHPNIAKIVDAGATPLGRPYFVMEYAPGEPVTEFADRKKLTIRQRLDLFVQICEAINHAHMKAVIHRDIKATNVLAFLRDNVPAVKVIDFGIAKALSGDRLSELTYNTDFGKVVGTPATMSPEQADGSADIDIRTDVYSLGVLLYELLTGVKPFDPKVLSQAADEEVRRIIRDVDPDRPSTRLTELAEGAAQAIAAARHATIESLTREFRSELEWIPLMAMRKERERRYASALQLAEEVRNYLQGKPLLAGPETLSYVVGKFARRNRAAVAGTGLALLALAAGGAAFVQSYRFEAALAKKDKSIAEEQQKAQEQRQVFDRQYAQETGLRLGITFSPRSVPGGLSRLARAINGADPFSPTATLFRFWQPRLMDVQAQIDKLQRPGRFKWMGDVYWLGESGAPQAIDSTSADANAGKDLKELDFPHSRRERELWHVSAEASAAPVEPLLEIELFHLGFPASEIPPAYDRRNYSFNAGHTRLAILANGEARVYRMQGGNGRWKRERRIRGPSEDVKHVCFLDSSRLVVVDADDYAMAVDCDSGGEVWSSPLRGDDDGDGSPPDSPMASPSGQFIAFFDREYIQLRHGPSGFLLTERVNLSKVHGLEAGSQASLITHVAVSDSGVITLKFHGHTVTREAPLDPAELPAALQNIHRRTGVVGDGRAQTLEALGVR